MTSDTAALARAKGFRRPSIAAPWSEQISRWLAEENALPGVELFRRAREAGDRGGKSALDELIRRLRPVERVPLVRFEGASGEFSQHDFGSVTVRYRSGATERVHVFASRLKWSRYAHVVLVPDEQEETLIRALLAAVELVTVWDNPKTVVVERRGELIVWNPIFGQMALDSRFAPELCWPRAARQRGPSRTSSAGSRGASSRAGGFPTAPISSASSPSGYSR